MYGFCCKAMWPPQTAVAMVEYLRDYEQDRASTRPRLLFRGFSNFSAVVKGVIHGRCMTRPCFPQNEI